MGVFREASSDSRASAGFAEVFGEALLSILSLRRANWGWRPLTVSTYARVEICHFFLHGGSDDAMRFTGWPSQRNQQVKVLISSAELGDWQFNLHRRDGYPAFGPMPP